MQAIGRTGGPDGPAAQKCTKAKPGKQGNPCFPFFANGFSIPSLRTRPYGAGWCSRGGVYFPENNLYSQACHA